MVPPRLVRLAALSALAALAVLAPACGGAPQASADQAAAQAIASADARLRGAWILERFTPATPLEPMLEELLRFQYGRLVVRFDGQRMVAESVGIHVDRTYKITGAKGDQFSITVYDEQGVSYDASCMFLEGGRIEIHATTAPWRGVAFLERS